MSFLRLRLRTLLVAIAFIAALIGTLKFGQRRGALQFQAALLAQSEAEHVRQAEAYEAKAAEAKAVLARPVPRYDWDTEERYQARVARWSSGRSQSGPEIKLWMLRAKEARASAAAVAKKKQQYLRAANQPWLSAPK